MSRLRNASRAGGATPVRGARKGGDIAALRRRNSIARRLLDQWRRLDSKLTEDTWPQVESVLNQNA